MNPKKRKKLLDWLKRSNDGLEVFNDVEDQVTELIKNARKQVSASSLKDVNAQIEKFRKSLDLTPLLDSLTDLKDGTNGLYADFGRRFETTLTDFQNRIESGISKIEKANTDTVSFYEEVGSIRGQSEVQAQELGRKLEATYQELLEVISEADANVASLLSELEEKMRQERENETNGVRESLQETNIRVSDAVEDIRDLRRLIQKVSDNRGGNANRNIAIGGNTSVLSQFTDINLKAGSNVTITYQANPTTKYTDITISASGSGGGGITREINNVAVNTMAGSTPDIDYVYLVSGTTTITLPTAIGNENLYTVKNVGSGVVTVDTTGGETIDDDLTVVMPVQYTSVDIISNGANWKIT